MRPGFHPTPPPFIRRRGFPLIPLHKIRAYKVEVFFGPANLDVFGFSTVPLEASPPAGFDSAVHPVSVAFAGGPQVDTRRAGKTGCFVRGGCGPALGGGHTERKAMAGPGPVAGGFTDKAINPIRVFPH